MKDFQYITVLTGVMVRKYERTLHVHVAESVVNLWVRFEFILTPKVYQAFSGR